jgi:hypothetical protein
MGKSSSRRRSPLGPPAGKQWAWITLDVLGSITFQALSLNARRILDFLLYEHTAHAGRENGSIGATYRQLEAWGCTPDDISKGFQELELTGFVQCTHRGLRQAGGGDHSRYEITFVSTFEDGNLGLPKHTWATVITRLNKKGIGSVRAVRAWLREEIQSRGGRRRRRAKRLTTPDIHGAPQVKSEPQHQLMGDAASDGHRLSPQVKGENSASEGLPSVLPSQPAPQAAEDEPVLPSFLDRRPGRGPNA